MIPLFDRKANEPTPHNADHEEKDSDDKNGLVHLFGHFAARHGRRTIILN